MLSQPQICDLFAPRSTTEHTVVGSDSRTLDYQCQDLQAGIRLLTAVSKIIACVCVAVARAADRIVLAQRLERYSSDSVCEKERSASVRQGLVSSEVVSRLQQGSMRVEGGCGG